MNWRRAAMLAIIPWVPTMAIILLNIYWHGIAGDSTWSNYLWRVGQIALLLYGGMTWALTMSKPYTPKDS